MLLTLFFRWTRRAKSYFLAGATQPVGRPSAAAARIDAAAGSAAALRAAQSSVAPLAGAAAIATPAMHLSVEVTRV